MHRNPGLQPQDQPKTVLDVFEEPTSYTTSEFNQKLPIDGDHLGHIRHRVYDEKRDRLQLEESKRHVHVKARRDAVLPKAMIGGPTGSLLVPIAD